MTILLVQATGLDYDVPHLVGAGARKKMAMRCDLCLLVDLSVPSGSLPRHTPAIQRATANFINFLTDSSVQTGMPFKEILVRQLNYP